MTFDTGESGPKIYGPSLSQMPSLSKIENDEILKRIADAAVLQEFEKKKTIAKKSHVENPTGQSG